LAKALARLSAVPVPITADPQSMSAATLAHAAWGYSVDVWNEAWSAQTKRNVVAGSIRFHARKGTLAALRQAAEMAGGVLESAVVPPSKTFLAPNRTEAERMAFYARHPQLRIYWHRNRGKRAGATVGRFFLDTPLSCPRRSDAVLRVGPRAYVWDRGVETPVTTIDRAPVSRTVSATDDIEVRLPGTSGRRTFCGGFPRFAVPSTAAARLYTLQTVRSLTITGEEILRRSASPSLRPMTVAMEPVSEPGQKRGLFPGDIPALSRFLVESTARERVYNRLYLHDPSRTPEARGRSTHLGAMRLSFPPFHAELLVNIEGRHHPLRFLRFMRGFMGGNGDGSAQRVIDALRDAKAARDKILVRFGITRPVLAGPQWKSGEVTAGEWRRRTR
jgi:hypothetical protein